MERYYYSESMAQTLGYCRKEMECNCKKRSLIILTDIVHTRVKVHRVGSEMKGKSLRWK